MQLGLKFCEVNMKKGKFCQIKSILTLTFFLLLSAAILPSALYAQRDNEYRGFWVDTFNTALNNHTDIVAVVNNAKAANSNAIFAQVRRRGDAWYLNSLEPKPDFTPIAAGFDPLEDLITTAHAEGIEGPTPSTGVCGYIPPPPPHAPHFKKKKKKVNKKKKRKKEEVLEEVNLKWK
jgi:uncharacterized lipoprotein YddW (UPF0748 family)